MVSVVGNGQSREGECAIEEDRRGTRTRKAYPHEKANLLKAEDLTSGQLRQAVVHTRQKLATSQRRTCRVIGLTRRGPSAAAAAKKAPTSLSPRQLDHSAAPEPSQSRLGHRLRARQARQRSELQDKMMTVLDEYTRQALAVTVRTRMRADDVLEALHLRLLRHGTPEYIHSDNGLEFIAQAMQDWSVSNLSGYIAVHLGRPDTTNASTEHFAARCSMQNGSRRLSRHKSSSTTGSNSTIIPSTSVPEHAATGARNSNQQWQRARRLDTHFGAGNYFAEMNFHILILTLDNTPVPCTRTWGNDGRFGETRRS